MMEGDGAKFFCGKRVLVTGAAQGIGYGIAEKLAKSGAVVLALDLSLEILQKLKAKHPKSIIPVALDLTNWNATSQALQSLFPIDLLVNNAGVAVIEPLETITEEQYDKTFNVNVKAAINLTKLVVSDLLARKSPGAVVILSSQASQAGLLNHSLYCASKGAIDAFCRAAALELGAKNIRINTVNPTVVMTELGRKIWSDPKMGEPMLAKIPLKKFAEVEDVVEAVIFLLSDKAKMITGSSLAVDGGFLAC